MCQGLSERAPRVRWQGRLLRSSLTVTGTRMMMTMGTVRWTRMMKMTGTASLASSVKMTGRDTVLGVAGL